MIDFLIGWSIDYAEFFGALVEKEKETERGMAVLSWSLSGLFVLVWLL